MDRRATFQLAVGLAVIAAIGLWLRPDPQREITFHAAGAAQSLGAGQDIRYSRVESTGPAECIGAALSAFEREPGAPALNSSCTVTPGEGLTLTLGARSVTRAFPSGWSLMPPLLAILLAFVLRTVIPALAVAILAAGLLAADFGVIDSAANVAQIMTPALTSPFNLAIYAFTIFLIGMVGIQLRCGGLDGFVDLLARRATGRRSAQAATAAMGGAVFFDDYANTIVVGASARPLTDRYRISREKLAYLVDSTAAPVAGIAVVSTWIGFEVGLFNAQADLLSTVGSGGYGVFFAILPYRFYCILSIVMVGLVAFTGRDFGPMLAAEERAASGAGLTAGGHRAPPAEKLTALGPDPDTPKRWINGVLPILVVLVGVLGGYASAGGSLLGDDVAIQLGSLDWWQAAFSTVGDGMGGNLGAYLLLLASIAGSATAATLAIGQGLLSVEETARAWWTAVRAVLPTLAILALAIAIREATTLVHADHFLVSLLGTVDPIILPFAVFLLAAITAFSTGTSWGTMGILMPVVVPLVYAQVTGHQNGALVMALAVSAVLDGAIFGDHCSPISDTTVMSSMASSCDHIDHVRTQAPYAIAVMLAAGFLGYVLTAWAATSAMTSYALGGFALAILLVLVGRRPAVATGEALE